MLVAKVSTKGIVNINKQKCFTVFKVGSKMQVTSRDYIQSGKLDIKCLANGVECVKGQNALTCLILPPVGRLMYGSRFWHGHYHQPLVRNTVDQEHILGGALVLHVCVESHSSRSLLSKP